MRVVVFVASFHLAAVEKTSSCRVHHMCAGCVVSSLYRTCIVVTPEYSRAHPSSSQLA